MPEVESSKEKSPAQKEAEILFKKIGLATEEERNRFSKLGTDDDLDKKYKVIFTNNSEVKNG